MTRSHRRATPTNPRASRRVRAARAVAVLAALVTGLLVALLPVEPAAAAGELIPPLPLPLQVLRAFAPPTEPWAAGNRGVDLAASAGEQVLAAAAGVVIYAGVLAGRGVISIDLGSIHTTYEPVDPVVKVGFDVTAGQVIGHVADEVDTCGPPGTCLHWGVRQGNSYLDPIGLLDVVPVRLLPIWTHGPPIWTNDPPTSSDVAALAATAASAPAARRRSPVEPAVGAVAGTALAMAIGGAAVHRKIRRSVRPASRAIAALPWYASGRSGSR